MGYVGKRRKPAEYASKSSHGYIIKDPKVEEAIKGYSLPKESEEIDLKKRLIIDLEEPKVNPIKSIIAIDGGYSEVFVKKEFPSSTISFFQFGALIFKTSDLEEMSMKPFIDPEDMSKLKEIQRFKLVIPTKNILIRNETSLINSFRKILFAFFLNEPKEDKFIESLRWFLFNEYGSKLSEWNLASCPNFECRKSNVMLSENNKTSDYSFECPFCKDEIYLTDVFRLHEAIDNELGAGGILGYLVTLLEQIVLIHLIRIILKIKPSLLSELLFIKDGPLAFFGQTATMFKPMRQLVSYLFSNHNLFLVGLEKSGAFVEHADQIVSKLEPKTALLLDNKYIYKYIIPGKADTSNPYGRTTYYGNKIIFKTKYEEVYVITLPTKEVLLSPQKNDFQNIDTILLNVEKLRCDMYASSLVPISLVNKLVSLSSHPSSIILEKFAQDSIINV